MQKLQETHRFLNNFDGTWTAASAGLDPGGTFLEGIMVGSKTVLQLLTECGRIETPAGQHRPHSILSVLRFEGPILDVFIILMFDIPFECIGILMIHEP